MTSVIKGDALHRRKAQGIYLVRCELPEGPSKPSAKAKPVSPEEQARAIIEQAGEDAELLVSEAHRQADSVRAAAYEDGYQAGMREIDAGKEILRQRLSEMEEEAAQQVSEFWKSIEPELLKLSVEIARKVIKHEISENKSLVLNTVNSGIEQLRERRELKLRISSSDYEFVREHKDEVIASYDGIRSVEVIEDRRVDAGGCVIESANGHLDGRIDTQLHEVERALLEAQQDGKCDIPTDTE